MKAIWCIFALLMFVLAEEEMMYGRSAVSKGDLLREVVHNAEFKVERARKLKVDLEDRLIVPPTLKPTLLPTTEEVVDDIIEPKKCDADKKVKWQEFATIVTMKKIVTKKLDPEELGELTRKITTTLGMKSEDIRSSIKYETTGKIQLSGYKIPTSFQLKSAIMEHIQGIEVCDVAISSEDEDLIDYVIIDDDFENMKKLHMFLSSNSNLKQTASTFHIDRDLNAIVTFYLHATSTTNYEEIHTINFDTDYSVKTTFPKSYYLEQIRDSLEEIFEFTSEGSKNMMKKDECEDFKNDLKGAVGAEVTDGTMFSESKECEDINVETTVLDYRTTIMKLSEFETLAEKYDAIADEATKMKDCEPNRKTKYEEMALLNCEKFNFDEPFVISFRFEITGRTKGGNLIEWKNRRGSNQVGWMVKLLEGIFYAVPILQNKDGTNIFPDFKHDINFNRKYETSMMWDGKYATITIGDIEDGEIDFTDVATTECADGFGIFERGKVLNGMVENLNSVKGYLNDFKIEKYEQIYGYRVQYYSKPHRIDNIVFTRNNKRTIPFMNGEETDGCTLTQPNPDECIPIWGKVNDKASGCKDFDEHKILCDHQINSDRVKITFSGENQSRMGLAITALNEEGDGVGAVLHNAGPNITLDEYLTLQPPWIELPVTTTPEPPTTTEKKECKESNRKENYNETEILECETYDFDKPFSLSFEFEVAKKNEHGNLIGWKNENESNQVGLEVRIQDGAFYLMPNLQNTEGKQFFTKFKHHIKLNKKYKTSMKWDGDEITVMVLEQSRNRDAYQLTGESTEECLTGFGTFDEGNVLNGVNDEEKPVEGALDNLEVASGKEIEITYEEWPETSCSGNDDCKPHPDSECKNEKSVKDCKNECSGLKDCTVFAYNKAEEKCCAMKPSCTSKTCKKHRRENPDWSIYVRSTSDPTDEKAVEAPAISSECYKSDWKKFPVEVYCERGGEKFPNKGYMNYVDQEGCEKFCEENAGCAGYFHRHGKNNCEGQCRIRSGTPPDDMKPGPLQCRFNEQGAKFSFFENPKGECYKSDWKKFPVDVICGRGGEKFPNKGYMNNVDQRGCEKFCEENAGCAGYFHRIEKNYCKGQCHIRAGTPPDDMKPGPLQCRFNEQGAKYSFFEKPKGGVNTSKNEGWRSY